MLFYSKKNCSCVITKAFCFTNDIFIHLKDLIPFHHSNSTHMYIQYNTRDSEPSSFLSGSRALDTDPPKNAMNNAHDNRIPDKHIAKFVQLFWNLTIPKSCNIEYTIYSIYIIQGIIPELLQTFIQFQIH